MNLKSLTNTVTSKAGTFGAIAGVVAGNPSGVDSIIGSMQQLLAGVIHVPNMQIMQEWTQSPYFKNGLLAYIAGLGVEAVNIKGTGKYGDALQKGALNYLIASGAVYLLWSATHSEIKGVNILGDNMKSTRENFSNAPTMAALMY